MLTKEEVVNKVKCFVNEVLATGLPLSRVILFGSYASNQQHEDSDIDVALVPDKFTGFGFEDRKFFSRINVKKEYVDIETKTYARKDFEAGDPFVLEIKSTGIEIV